MNYSFDIPTHHKSIIKVIGVGGGGSNAVKHMYNKGIKDVEFVVVNTDVQALKANPVPLKLQIGENLTDGLGAGANPERGRSAAIESKEDIRDLLSDNTKMVFITAGMGGGTGTGAAPIIAKIAREMDILTVGICTAPFGFEGKKKLQQAENGISELKQYCDTVLVIMNDKLREIYGNLSIREAFAQADLVLTNAAKSIAEIITVTSEVNVDFEDVKTVMSNSGAAVMGSAVAEGEGRALRAVEEALNSPLLNNTDIFGAQKILLSIASGEDEEVNMDEFSLITDYIQQRAGESADVIFGQGIDPALGSHIRVTVIATGFEERRRTEEKKTVFHLDSEKQINPSEQKKDPVKNSVFNQQTFLFEGNKEVPPVKEVKKEEQNEPEFFQSEIKPKFVKEEEKTQENEIVFEFTKPITVKEFPKTEEDLEKERLEEQARERIKRLKGLSSQLNFGRDEFKEMLDEPAFKRKNVNFQDVPHSSERNISKFNLNDENEILGNNKFLHDNVD